MKVLKLALALLFVTSGNMTLAKTDSRTLTYGIHLYFDEMEFVDVMTLTQNPDGTVTGHMSVPNDFEGSLENIVIKKQTLEFDLLVPKNASRPKDLVFHYQARLFDSSKRQMIGFVTLKNDPDFVASFVGFLRDKKSARR